MAAPERAGHIRRRSFHVSLEGVVEFINRKAIDVFGYLLEDILTIERWRIVAYPDKDYRGEVVANSTGRVDKALSEGFESMQALVSPLQFLMDR
jgi:PAS domain-containing protein